LDNQSIALSYQLKHLQEKNDIALRAANTSLQVFEQQINELKSARRAKSGLLQKRLFECYNFLNARGETRNLIDIFGITDETTPPSGAGECAAPKLLQFAFAHQLKPIAMAEFWYGNSPQSEIRKHGLYYPACNSKCKPILAHMLSATETDPNPMLINPAFGRELPIIYEDAQIIIVNKPTEFLSVPGKEISDSVYTRILAAYPDITGPVIIHRLDMSTSGIMILARDKDSHFHIQNQFIRHKITKKYIALLDGIVKSDAGTINLPLRVDLDDRPRQVVCHTYGKASITKWERLEIKKNQTRVAFYPQTGRTHQLRVHAAHQLGLGIPIIGDDLYGSRADRLFLHAAAISFIHPSTKQKMNIEVDAPF
ncbi:MAG TPA: RluA family pseudouridine synthase, partial [Saprospiraceae bacterium]|nr:RluA family pseudouridine synthase [Saprospiraceae bacterium]